MPKNAMSDYFQGLSNNHERTPTNRPLRIGLSQRGRLVLEPVDPTISTTSSWPWIIHLQLADDVHSNNLLAEIYRRDDDGRKELRVRCVRCIDAGESLRLWFSEEVAALMGVPFLTPASIRGK